jgi:hypothetical protein
VYLQAGTRDIDWDQPELNWFSSNLRVAAALAEKGYDLRFVLGDGGHDPKPHKEPFAPNRCARRR